MSRQTDDIGKTIPKTFMEQTIGAETLLYLFIYMQIKIKLIF